MALSRLSRLEDFRLLVQPRLRSMAARRPFHPTPITIEITGGTDVAYSNVTLTFGSPRINRPTLELNPSRVWFEA